MTILRPFLSHRQSPQQYEHKRYDDEEEEQQQWQLRYEEDNHQQQQQEKERHWHNVPNYCPEQVKLKTASSQSTTSCSRKCILLGQLVMGIAVGMGLTVHSLRLAATRVAPTMPLSSLASSFLPPNDWDQRRRRTTGELDGRDSGFLSSLSLTSSTTDERVLRKRQLLLKEDDGEGDRITATTESAEPNHRLPNDEPKDMEALLASLRKPALNESTKELELVLSAVSSLRGSNSSTEKQPIVEEELEQEQEEQKPDQPQRQEQPKEEPEEPQNQQEHEQVQVDGESTPTNEPEPKAKNEREHEKQEEKDELRPTESAETSKVPATVENSPPATVAVATAAAAPLQNLDEEMDLTTATMDTVDLPVANDSSADESSTLSAGLPPPPDPAHGSFVHVVKTRCVCVCVCWCAQTIL